MVLNKFISGFAMLAFGLVFCACSDGGKTAGTSEESEGVVAIKDREIAGVSQKGPLLTGASVTVQGVDCKTMELTGEHFESVVKSDKGDYNVDSITLSSTCALFEVSGYFLNEVTGVKSSDGITLQAITNLKNRKSVNVNILTSLEYARVKNLVAEKGMIFADAKKQAEKEVLASFGIAGATRETSEFENLNIFEKGDGNAALLAVSVMMLASAGDANLAERLDEYSATIAKNGTLDERSKTELANWARTAEASSELDSIRKNIERWGFAESVPTFENYVKTLADDDSTSTAQCNTDGTDESELGEWIDERDGQIYSTVKIGCQIWMAQNLNYETESSYCYNDSLKYCDKYGRLYTWEKAMDVCPSGWRLPDSTDWKTLVATVGGWSNAGKNLKSRSGWSYFEKVDDYDFSVLPGGFRHNGGSFNLEGNSAYLWVASESPDADSYALSIVIENASIDSFSDGLKDNGYSVRCIKNLN